jgi:hypothetical protein
MSNIYASNNSLVAKLSLESKAISRDKEEALSQKSLQHDAAVRNLPKQYSEQVLKTKSDMRQKLKEKDMLISEYQDLAQDVATEFNDLQNLSRAQARAYSKMEVNLKLKADSRLEEVKHSKRKIESLRESLDSVKETYKDQLEAAQLEIAQLKQELAGQSDYMLHLEDELIHAQEQIQVSHWTFRR